MGVFVYSACIVWRMKSPDAVSMLAIFLRRMQNVVVTTHFQSDKSAIRARTPSSTQAKTT